MVTERLYREICIDCSPLPEQVRHFLGSARKYPASSGSMAARELTDILTSLAFMARSPSVAHDFWSIVASELLFIFDALAVVVNYYGELERFTIHPREYELLTGGVPVRKKWREDCETKRKVIEKTLDAKRISRLKTKYEHERLALRRGVKIGQSSEYGGLLDPRLIGAESVYIAPILSSSDTKSNVVATVEILMDPNAPTGRDKQLVQIYRDMLEPPGYPFIAFLHQMYLTYEQECIGFEPQTKSSQYRYLREKEQLFDKAYNQAWSASELVDNYSEQFCLLTDAFQAIEQRIHSTLFQKVKNEELGVLMFLLGELDPDRLVQQYSYILLPEQLARLLGVKHTALTMRSRTKPFNLSTLAKVWNHPWETESSIIGSVVETGCPQYSYDGPNDVRVLRYGAHTKDAEDRLYSLLYPQAKGFLHWKCVLEIPLGGWQNDSGTWSAPAVLLYFTKKPPSHAVKRILFEGALTSQLAALQAIAAQTLAQQKRARRDAEDWMLQTAGLRHKFLQEAQIRLSVLEDLERLVKETSTADTPSYLEGIGHIRGSAEHQIRFFEFLSRFGDYLRSEALEKPLEWQEPISEWTQFFEGNPLDWSIDMTSPNQFYQIAQEIWQEILWITQYPLAQNLAIASSEEWRTLPPLRERALIEFILFELLSNAVQEGSENRVPEVAIRIGKEGLSISVASALKVIKIGRHACDNTRPNKKHAHAEPCFNVEKLSLKKDDKSIDVLCERCLREALFKRLEKCYEPAKHPGGGYGLFLVKYYVTKVYGGRAFNLHEMFSDWNEWEQKKVNFGFVIPIKGAAWLQ